MYLIDETTVSGSKPVNFHRLTTLTQVYSVYGSTLVRYKHMEGR